MAGPLVVVAVSVMTILGSLTVTVFGQIEPAFVPVATALGNGAAVGGLIYFAKKILSGDLIARPTSVVERELVELLAKSNTVNDKLVEVLREEQRREDRFIAILTEQSALSRGDKRE